MHELSKRKCLCSFRLFILDIFFFQRTKTHSTVERVFELVNVPRGNGRSRVAGRPTVYRNVVRRTVSLPDTSNAQTTVQGILKYPVTINNSFIFICKQPFYQKFRSNKKKAKIKLLCM